MTGSRPPAISATIARMFPTIPQGIELWQYLLCMGGAVLIIGIAKAGFGGGIGILAVPLTILVLPPDRAIGFMLPVLIVADALSNLHHIRYRSGPHLRWSLSGAVIGVVLGSLILWWMQSTIYFNAWLNLCIGVICLLFVVLQVYRLSGGKVPRVPDGRWPGRVAGGLAGTVSTLAHSAGPIMTIYLLERQMEKRLLVGTLVLFFFILNVMKLPTFFGLGLINPATLLEGLWFVPLVPVGTLLGVWLNKRISEKPFVTVMYLGAAAAASHMLYKSGTVFLGSS